MTGDIVINNDIHSNTTGITVNGNIYSDDIGI